MADIKCYAHASGVCVAHQVLHNNSALDKFAEKRERAAFNAAWHEAFHHRRHACGCDDCREEAYAAYRLTRSVVDAQIEP